MNIDKSVLRILDFQINETVEKGKIDFDMTKMIALNHFCPFIFQQAGNYYDVQSDELIPVVECVLNPENFHVDSMSVKHLNSMIKE